MTTPGHNSTGSTKPSVKNIDAPDLARALEWRAMRSNLSAGARLIVHVVAKVMPSDGIGCSPSIEWIAANTGQSVRTTKTKLEEIKKWESLNVKAGAGRSRNTYEPAFSYADVIAEYCEKYGKLNPVVVRDLHHKEKSEAVVVRDLHHTKDVKSPSGAKSAPQETVVVQISHPTNSLSDRQTDIEVENNAKAEQRHFGSMSVSRSDFKKEEVPKSGEIVVPINSNSGETQTLERTLNAVLVEPFGADVANQICHDVVAWSEMKPIEALHDLSVKIETYGSLNLFEAWQAVRSKSGVRNQGAYFFRILTTMLDERGRRMMPKKSTVSPARARPVMTGGI